MVAAARERKRQWPSVISDGDEGLEAVAAAAEERKEEDKQGAETRRREHRGERTNRLLKL